MSDTVSEERPPEPDDAALDAFTLGLTAPDRTFPLPNVAKGNKIPPQCVVPVGFVCVTQFTVTTPPPHIINPSSPLSAPATSPLQQQMQDDYATQLRSAQHDLLLQNPSGTTRPEMGLSRALNGFTPR